jgi:serralysin
MAENESSYCMAVGPHAGQRNTRAAAVKSLLWANGQTITVRFLGGSEQLRARVRSVAAEWTAADTANLRFAFVERGRADIRISFVAGNGSWSTIGTVARQVDQTEPTMNYGWLTDDSSDDTLRRVVLHEFGHAVGLIHEHQNPKHAIDWNRDAVVADLSRPPNSWDLEKIERNMFAAYEPQDVEATDTDPLSIMMYPIPRSWTNDGFSAGLNSALSTKDHQLIQQVYSRG